ncbi:MAG: hypothetical protein HQM13_15565 [SAR324 cluster bacterium]|nr:hypothetical protein [SAR324 cluster bacterium]
MVMKFKMLVLIGAAGIMACQSSPELINRSRPLYPSTPDPDRSFLYPSMNNRDILFLCESIYRIPQFKSKPYVNSSGPELLVVTENTITVYFSNDYTQSVARPAAVDLPPGTYPCR